MLQVPPETMVTVAPLAPPVVHTDPVCDVKVTGLPDAPPLDRGRKDPRLIDALCAQCHSTPSPRYPDGAAVRKRLTDLLG